MHVLLVGPPNQLPSDVQSHLTVRGYEIATAVDYDEAINATRRQPVDVVVVPGARPGGADESAFRALVRNTDSRQIATVVVGAGGQDLQLADSALVDVASKAITKEELHGRLLTIGRYMNRLQEMERELGNLRRVAKRINRYFNEVEQELRLAGRLQRDFLPKGLTEVGPLRFSTVYRPVSWVSGDIYDIYRVDEKHVAFYVADAVGHGTAAGLLTMFIKQALVSKSISDAAYQVLDPSQSMLLLNEALAGQMLPNCQFVTACYGLINLETLELRFARGGHPYPVHISGSGAVSELKSAGGLLGLFEEEAFPTRNVTLRPGDKVIFYTDGLEVAFASDKQGSGPTVQYRQAFRELAGFNVREIASRLEEMLNDEEGSLAPQDDVTLVAVEVSR